MSSAQRVVAVLLALSLVVGTLTGDQLYFRLSYLWGLLLILSWVFSKTALRGIQVKRRARFHRSQVGLVFEEKIELRNPGRLPRLWIEVRDGSDLPGISSAFVITMISPGETRTFTSRTRLVERGVYQLAPTILSSGDPFGLFQDSKEYTNNDSLLVYPQMVPVNDFPNPPGQLPGGDALRRRTPQITSNAAGIREYAPGDPLNRIHWLNTARHNRLIAKEFELDPLAEVWIVVDAYEKVHHEIPRPEIDPNINIG